MRPKGIYADMSAGVFPHRVPYESDPATPRPSKEEKPLVPQPQWNIWIRNWNRFGLPGIEGKYIEMREWFRDNNMRLFHRLHNALAGSSWISPYPSSRTKKGTFWEDGSDGVETTSSFVIYPGKTEGRVGQEIVIVDALDPGQYESYKAANAVISRCGGRLSHGAILLRELKKPSAVIPECPLLSSGTLVRLKNQNLEVMPVRESK